MYVNARDLKSYYSLLRGSLAISFVCVEISVLDYQAAKDGELIIEIPKEVQLSYLKRDVYVRTFSNQQTTEYVISIIFE